MSDVVSVGQNVALHADACKSKYEKESSLCKSSGVKNLSPVLHILAFGLIPDFS